MPADLKFLHLRKGVDHILGNTDFAQLPDDQNVILRSVQNVLKNLPKNTVENLKFVLNQINENSFFSEFGWAK